MLVHQVGRLKGNACNNITKLPGSNLVRESDYPDLSFFVIFLSPSSK
jgi:hypothetical protein